MPELLSESFTYNDIVFRNSCALMQRHPEYVNYGNAPPTGSNLFLRFDKNASEYDEKKDMNIPNPDYLYRRMYKIDWKVFVSTSSFAFAFLFLFC